MSGATFIFLATSLTREPTRKRVQALEPDDDFPITPLECPVHVRRHDHVFPLWVLLAECEQVGSIEIACRPLALYGQRLSPARRQHKIHFMSALIAPVMQLLGLEVCHDLIQYKMFPQNPQVLGTQFLPATVVTHKSRVEAVHLRGRHDLICSMRAEGADYVGYKRRLQDLQISTDCRAAHCTGTRKAGSFKDPAALGQHQLDELLERTAALQPEQFLDVLGPVGVHPLLKITLGELISQKERRQSPA